MRPFPVLRTFLPRFRLEDERWHSPAPLTRLRSRNRSSPAAPGWRKWYDVVEAEAAGQVVSRTLVEMAGLGPGDTVLDIGTGYGEPALTAARAVMPGGRVIATDIAADMLAIRTGTCGPSRSREC